ncbi:Alpha tocopherol transfer protein, partial [Operophtera brumata]
MLIAAKGSVERVKRRLDNYYKYRGLAPEIINDRIELLKDPNFTLWNSLITITLFTDTDSSNLTSQDLGDIRAVNDCMLGDIWIIDLKHSTIGHAMKMNPLIINKAIKIYQDGAGLRIFGIHIINCSMANVAQFVLNILKQVLSQKLGERIKFHDTLESLYEEVPKEYLPQDYGGDLQSIAEISDRNLVEIILIAAKGSVEKVKRRIDNFYKYRVYKHRCQSYTTEREFQYYYSPTQTMVDIRAVHDFMLGDIWILDLKHCTIGHAMKMNPMMLHKAVKIFRQLLSEKVFGRIKFHDTLESLYEEVPKEYLPKDYDNIGKVIRSQETREYLIEACKQTSDESKRPRDAYDEDMYPAGQHPIFAYSMQERQQILEETGFNEKQLQADVDTVLDWYQKQPHLPEDVVHRNVVEIVLIAAKGSIERDGLGLRMFGIHVINCRMANVMQFALNFFKPLVSEKVFERIKFHNTLESLYEEVPKEYLPKDYGGDLQSIAVIS